MEIKHKNEYEKTRDRVIKFKNNKNMSNKDIIEFLNDEILQYRERIEKPINIIEELQNKQQTTDKAYESSKGLKVEKDRIEVKKELEEKNKEIEEYKKQ